MEERIYVVAGKDEPLVNVHCLRLIEELIEPGHRAMGLSSYEGDEVGAADVLDELRTLPFLAPRRVVVVRDADSFVSRNRDILESYFENPSRTGVLVLVMATWDSRTRLAKKLPQVGRLLSVEPPKMAQLPGHLVEYARTTCKKRLDGDAAQALLELAGVELPLLYNEIEKLAVYVGQAPVITHQDVESLVGHNRIFGAFEVIDAILEGAPGRAVERLRGMFRDDREAEYKVVGAFAFHFRRLFAARQMLDKGIGAEQIAGSLRIWNQKDRFFAQVRRSSLPQIAAILQELGAMDYRIKTGRMRIQVDMEQLVLQLAGRASAAGFRISDSGLQISR